MQLPQVNPVDAAISQLAKRLTPVPRESIPTTEASGRILAAPLLADRDSPALDVSAMDGYAIRLRDLSEASPNRELQVAAVAAAGSPPIALPTGKAVQIFTGAAVPPEADCVVRREDTLESLGCVRIQVAREQLTSGQNIRRRAENIARGQAVLEAGTPLHSSALGALASFGGAEILVRRKLRVVILNTGDELAAMGQPVQPWQIRDSNGPLLASWLAGKPWIEVIERSRVADVFSDVVNALSRCCEIADAVILTGGVSMGDADYVPDALQKLGGEIVFHRLPIRPGRPVLGATLHDKLILGLPGNPVSVAVTARVIGLPLLEALAAARNTAATTRVLLENPDDKTLDLSWYRLVEHDADGSVRLAASRGSGDLVSLARSHGVVEVPPNQSGPGPWRLLSW